MSTLGEDQEVVSFVSITELLSLTRYSKEGAVVGVFQWEWVGVTTGGTQCSGGGGGGSTVT